MEVAKKTKFNFPVWELRKHLMNSKMSFIHNDRSLQWNDSMSCSNVKFNSTAVAASVNGISHEESPINKP